MRRPVKKRRAIAPDQKFQSVMVTKLIHYVMERGKKSVAEGLIYRAFEMVANKTKEKPLEVFEQAVKNISPVMEIRSRRVGGANYQVPHEVGPIRRLTLALRWLKLATNTKKGMPMATRLAEEIILAAKNEGEAVKRKENVHKMAEANRAFAHFALSRKFKKKS